MGIKAKVIYLVTNGDDYGRYNVDYAFSSRQEAHYIRGLFKPHGNVIPIALDMSPTHPRGQKPHRVLVNDNGKTAAIYRIANDYDFVKATNGDWFATTWRMGHGEPKEIARELRWVPKVKAYIARMDGWQDVYVPAETASKARHLVVSALREAGYTDSGQYHLVSVRRAKQYDAWAHGAEKRHHKQEEMPVWAS